MNIFKALSEGNGSISETNITSFLNYLCDSSNELNNSFFVLFIDLISDSELFDLLDIKSKTIRQNIISFSSKYIVVSEAEYAITGEDVKTKIPDILIKIIEKSTENEIAYFIIENKIKKGAITKNQVEMQYKSFKSSEDYEPGKPVYSILISPDEEAFEQTYNDGLSENRKTYWFKWVNYTNPECSIEALIRKLIRLEQNAEIEPIDLNTQFILKSFIDYLASEFTERVNGKRNFSYKGFKEVDAAYATINNEEFCIKRYSNNMIRVFDIEGNIKNIEVKPFLRELKNQYSLKVDVFNSSGGRKNTHILGREIIKEINNKG